MEDPLFIFLTRRFPQHQLFTDSNVSNNYRTTGVSNNYETTVTNIRQQASIIIIRRQMSVKTIGQQPNYSAATALNKSSMDIAGGLTPLAAFQANEIHLEKMRS